MWLLFLSLLAPLQGQDQAAQEPQHPHAHEERFTTDRESPVRLALPLEEDAFSFAIFGDRTGGPASGVKILAEAVDEVNVLQPDLVMTVGDLIQGYNQQAEWEAQAREYLGIMNRLTMPWFPVAGNHDVYWRGPNRPAEEHEGNYEQTFGPLWYAFEHKDSWFVVLYTDEPNPDSGERNFNKPDSQRMSPEQFAWLRGTLERTSEAKHVFVFMHHPRWFGGNYGSDWEKVHKLLAAAGNVRAVFAGHIHQMRYSGVRDGIEYFTLATVGGSNYGDMPEAGFLHHYHYVTVRDGGIAVASLPVGSVDDPRKVTAELSAECRKVADSFRPTLRGEISFTESWGVQGEIEVTLSNPVSRPLEVTLQGDCADPRWYFLPDHEHLTLAPGETASRTMRVRRLQESIDGALRLPDLVLHTDYLGEGLRVPMPEVRVPVPVATPQLPPSSLSRNAHLVLDGVDDHLAISTTELALPDGPFTVEFMMRADRFAGRQGVVNKTESSEWGWFLNNGTPNFMVHLQGKGYVEVAGPAGMLQPGQWYHLAGVFDGKEIRTYVDGKLVARKPASGKRTVSQLPLLIGADVDGRGRGTSWFAGALDEIRISTGARYTAEQFEPRSHHVADEATLLLLHCNELAGPWLRDASPRARHPRALGGLRVGTD